MKRFFPAVIVATLLWAASITGAAAQCGTSAPANKFCGNDTGSSALAGWRSIPASALSAIGGGMVLGNPTGASAVPIGTIAPILGVPGSSQGQIGLAGATSGTAVLRAQSVAGSAVSLLPTAAGTLVGTATSPLAIDPATGLITCATCVTSSGGGAITGTAPISVSGAGVVSINAPYGTLTASNGGIVYSGATNLAILSGTATARQMLQSGASGAPAWSTATWPATTTINRILYSSAANVVGEITTGNSSVLITSAGGVPSLSTTLPPVTLTTPNIGVATGTSLALGGATIGANALAVTGTSLFNNGVTMGAALTYGGVTLSNAVTGTGNMVLSASPTFSGTIAAANANFNGGISIANSSATGFTIGPGGAINPVLQIDNSTASQASGLYLAGGVAAGPVQIAVISSAANASLTINAKGSGGITIGNSSTGAITLTRATTMSAALTYGGVTLNNAVTGTGNMVLGTSPNLTTPTTGTNGGTGGSLAFNGSTSGTATVTVSAVAGTVNFRLPPSNGTNLQFLQTDGSGNTSWVTAGGSGTVTSAQIIGAGLTVNSGTCTITTTGACTLTTTAASKSDQETGTSTTTVVTPANQKNNDSAAKAWCNWTGATAGTNACNAGYGVTSVTKTGTGAWTVNFSTAFASATNYSCVVNSEGGSILTYGSNTSTTTTWGVFSVNLAGASTDPVRVNIACYGRQ